MTTELPRLGPYEILHSVSTGDVAQLLLARPIGVKDVERVVILRVLDHELAQNPRVVSSFLDSARLTATLEHPNIARVLDRGKTEDGRYFFATEYVHGEDVRHLMAAAAFEWGSLTQAGTMAILFGACEALHYAHERNDPAGWPLGIVHGAISPSTIVVMFDGTVKVVDFGSGGERMHVRGKWSEKLAYSSPEQCLGETLDRRSDVYSLGAVLYHLSAGRPPYESTDAEELRLRIIQGPLAPPSTGVEGYPPELERIVMRAMARDPERRFPSALALQNALQEYCNDEGILPLGEELAELVSRLFGQKAATWRKLKLLTKEEPRDTLETPIVIPPETPTVIPLDKPKAVARPQAIPLIAPKLMPPPKWKPTRTLLIAVAIAVAGVGLAWALL